MRGWSRWMLVLAAAPWLAGCYAYTDVDRSAVPPGATVRVSVERDEAVRHVDALGGLRERVEGQVAEQTSPTALALTVRQAATPAQGGMFNAFVTFPWSGVTRVELKRFSPTRTALLAGGATAVAIAVLSVLEGSSKSGPGEGPGSEDAVRIPLVRVRW